MGTGGGWLLAYFQCYLRLSWTLVYGFDFTQMRTSGSCIEGLTLALSFQIHPKINSVVLSDGLSDTLQK